MFGKKETPAVQARAAEARAAEEEAEAEAEAEREAAEAKAAAEARDTYETTYTSGVMQIQSENNQNPFPFLPISPTEFMLDENQLNAYISYTYTELLRAIALTKGEVDTGANANKGVLGGYYHEADGLRTAETDKCFPTNEKSCDRTTYANCTDYCNMFHSILASSD